MRQDSPARFSVPQPRRAAALRWVLAPVVLASLTLGLAGSARAQALKVGVFDKQRIVDESRLGIAARERFEGQQQQAEQQVSERQRAFEALQAEYNQKAQVLSEERRLDMQRQVARARDEWQAAASNADRDLQRAYQTALLEIVGKMDPVIAEFGRQQGFDLLFDQTQAAFWSQPLDVTQAIIEALNTRFP